MRGLSGRILPLGSDEVQPRFHSGQPKSKPAQNNNKSANKYIFWKNKNKQNNPFHF